MSCLPCLLQQQDSQTTHAAPPPCYQGMGQAYVGTCPAGLPLPCGADCDAAAGGVCVPRVVAGLAEGLYPELEALVLPDMLRSAIISVMQVGPGSQHQQHRSQQ